MGRIIGGVEIDRDPPGMPAAAALMPLSANSYPMA